ncbi:cyclin-dependent kinase inhibitor 2c-related [Anaeramoeba ignava]|uniref:Cyclin-dependent kinase inhibitor 2c-related n=1 Tax=Anaeramoeba ignava TaxID=1746090 RepID=A0A9Q0LH28_ANAIG|nr:cyclin-dependent kinase inhibitor 2c-related [Anaeramoeba ignava]
MSNQQKRKETQTENQTEEKSNPKTKSNSKTKSNPQNYEPKIILKPKPKPKSKTKTNPSQKQVKSAKFRRTPLAITHIHLACRKSSDYNSLLSLLSQEDYDINAKTWNETALHIACRTGTIPDIIRALVIYGANVHEKADETPLHLACKHQADEDVIRILLASGANPNERNVFIKKFDIRNIRLILILPKKKSKWTSLHIACINKAESNIIRLLIAAGADVNIPAGFTPLHYACKENLNLDIITLLLISGADVNAQSGFTPLYLACKNNCNPMVVKILLSSRADPNPYSALHVACENSANLEIIELLLCAGANYNSKNEETPEEVCIRKQNFETSKIIKDFIENPKPFWKKHCKMPENQNNLKPEKK